MLILEEKEKKFIILKDKEKIEIMTLKGNPIRIQIECQDGTFLVDEVTQKRIKEIKMEQEQIKQMNNLKKENL